MGEHMFKASRHVTAILRAGLPLGSALSNGIESQVIVAARGLASVAAEIGAELTGTRSNALISRSRAYQDQASNYLVECCEGIVASARALEQSAGRDPGTYEFALYMLTSYYDLVKDATSGAGMSPHAMLGGPPQFSIRDPFSSTTDAWQSHSTVDSYGAMMPRGRDERVIRGRALAAQARAEKARLAGDAEPTGRAVRSTSAPISDIVVEATGDYDIGTYHALLAQGASEVVARASAKAHLIREQKRRIAEETS